MIYLTREIFEQEVDKSNINSKELFDLINNILSWNIDETIIEIKDLIDYANIRYELWEFPKVIYYCHYWLSQSPSKKDAKKLLNIILSSIQKISDNSKSSEPVNRVKENKNKNITNTDKVVSLIKSTKISSIILTSYSARKQSSMTQVNQENYDNIYASYKSYLNEWKYYLAFNDIYFLFSDSYLKENISHNQELLLEFHDFCTQWLKKI